MTRINPIPSDRLIIFQFLMHSTRIRSGFEIPIIAEMSPAGPKTRAFERKIKPI